MLDFGDCLQQVYGVNLQFLRLVEPSLGLKIAKHPTIPVYLIYIISRYILEVVCFVCVLGVSIIYTEQFYVLPVLVKTLLTIAVWVRYCDSPFSKGHVRFTLVTFEPLSDQWHAVAYIGGLLWLITPPSQIPRGLPPLEYWGNKYPSLETWSQFSLCMISDYRQEEKYKQIFFGASRK